MHAHDPSNETVMPSTGFLLQAEDKGSRARAGLVQTAHGIVQTPLFMPVGTLGTVKGLSSGELQNSVGAG
ncbi:MAG: hypothetical protein ACO31H_07480, partial [Bacteroidia bacterium]